MQSDTYLTINEAAARAPGRPHASAIWRWARKGIKSRDGSRVRLDHIRAGGRILIPESALDTFLRKLAERDCQHFDSRADAPPPAPPARRTSPALRRKQIEQARRTLAEHGITWTPAEGGETGGAR